MMKATEINETVFLECTNISARFNITQTRLVSIKGSNFFGGLLDRCIQSPYAEIFYKQNNGLTYVRNISNITMDSVSSLPVSVCFCTNEGQPNCGYQPSSVKVRKGHTFTISLTAVDQIGHSVEANIINSITSSYGGLGEGQHFQPVGTNCIQI